MTKRAPGHKRRPGRAAQPIEREARGHPGDAEATASRPLFVGPWIGELGHELMFVGMARAAAHGRPYVMACSRASSEPFYADFANEFVAHDIRCEGMIAVATAETRPQPAAVLRWVAPGMDQFTPCEYHGKGPVRWRHYGKQGQRKVDVIAVHARNRPHVPARNWSQGNWNVLARRLFSEGLASRIICVGLKRHALMVEGALDMRDAPLTAQMDALRTAGLIVGPSSGPMHLASHCDCPQLVWCGGGASEVKRTHRRYTSEWNPFKTLVDVHDVASWQPSLEAVWSWLTAFLPRIPAEKQPR